jgi:hypothetical protein
MASGPWKNLLTILDTINKWEGRIKTLGILSGLLVTAFFLLAGAIGAAVATAIHATTSFLSAVLITLPLALSVAMVTALMKRYQYENPIELCLAALLTLVGNSLVTRWLGLGLHIDLMRAFSLLGFIDFGNNSSAGSMVPVQLKFIIFVLLAPFTILWAYFDLYGVVGFIIATVTGLLVGRIGGGIACGE